MIHIVTPTLSVERVPGVKRLAHLAAAAGIGFTAVANGKQTEIALRSDGVNTVSMGKNGGFAEAVNYGVASVDSPRWVFLVNDDVDIPSIDVIVRHIELAGDDYDLLYFGSEYPLSIPMLRHTLAAASLMSGVFKALRRTAPEVSDGVVSNSRYLPFSAIAIRFATWRCLDGLDERFPFMFEDADFIRRYRLGSERAILAIRGSGLVHTRGVTGRRHVSRVLPCAIWGAKEYLSKWHTTELTARILLCCALVPRFVLAPFARTKLSDHVRGTASAFVHLVRNVPPELPDFDAN